MILCCNLLTTVCLFTAGLLLILVPHSSCHICRSPCSHSVSPYLLCRLHAPPSLEQRIEKEHDNHLLGQLKYVWGGEGGKGWEDGRERGAVKGGRVSEEIMWLGRRRASGCEIKVWEVCRRQKYV